MRGVAKAAGLFVLLLVLLVLVWLWMRPGRGTTGEVSTHFRWLGPYDRIVVDGFDDP